MAATGKGRGQARGGRLSILLVDDEPDILASLSALIQTWIDGAEVAIALSGEDALARARGRDFDVLLTDFRMPGMDGVELAERFTMVSPSTRRLLLSAFSENQKVEKSKGEGKIDEALSKPVEPAKLIAAIMRASTRSQSPP
ncbi:MAG: response regulator [Euryarchaeota archaeon]|nr:response regulator [Euryarchaeota archaeon]